MTAAETERHDTTRRQLLDDLLELVRHGILEVNRGQDGKPTFELTPDGERAALDFIERSLLRGQI